jgi:hypothetical protein
VSGAVVGEAKQRAGAESSRLGLGDGRLGHGFGEVFAVGHAFQVTLQILGAQVERPFVQRDTFDEGEFAVAQLQAQLGQGLEATGLAEIGGNQAAVVEVEHAMSRAPGQFEAARMAQLANELDDRRQPDAAERTF